MTPKQKKFAELYTQDREFFGNGVQAYAEVYDCDMSTTKGYRAARAAASRLLANVNILGHINKLLDVVTNEQFVDKQLAFLITQNADLHVKLGAIREYNELKQRITKKTEQKVKLELPQITLEVISKQDLHV